jgi:glycerophosphoryl diester phosphodiesterase
MLVDGLKALTFQIVGYTVNDSDKIAAMNTLDVDGIMSDFPDRLL